MLKNLTIALMLTAFISGCGGGGGGSSKKSSSSSMMASSVAVSSVVATSSSKMPSSSSSSMMTSSSVSSSSSVMSSSSSMMMSSSSSSAVVVVPSSSSSSSQVMSSSSVSSSSAVMSSSSAAASSCASGSICLDMTSSNWIPDAPATLAINGDGKSLNVTVATGGGDDGAHVLFTDPINLQNATLSIVVRPDATFVSTGRNIQPYIQTHINNCSVADAGNQAATNGCKYVALGASGGTQVGGNWVGNWCWVPNGNLAADTDIAIECNGFSAADFNSTTPNGNGDIAVGIKQNGGGAGTAGGTFIIKSFTINLAP